MAIREALEEVISCFMFYFNRRMWRVQNVMCVEKDRSTWTQRIPRVVPAASVLE